MLGGALEAGYTHVRFLHVSKLLLQPFCVGGPLTGVALVVGLRSVVAAPVWEGHLLRAAVTSHTLVGYDLWDELSGDRVKQLSTGPGMTWTQMWKNVFGNDVVQRRMNLWLDEGDEGLCALVRRAVDQACTDPLLSLTPGAPAVRKALLRCVVVDTREVPETSRIVAELHRQLSSSLGAKVNVAERFLPLRAGVQLASLGSMRDIPFVSENARAHATALSHTVLCHHVDTLEASISRLDESDEDENIISAFREFISHPDSTESTTGEEYYFDYICDYKKQRKLQSAIDAGLDETVLQLHHRHMCHLRRALHLSSTTTGSAVSTKSSKGAVHAFFRSMGKKFKSIFRKKE